MSEYLNEEFCDFNNDASATSFGWNFQVGLTSNLVTLP